MSPLVNVEFGGRLDRLSALIERFRVHAALALDAGSDDGVANFFVYRLSSGDQRLVFLPNKTTSGVACVCEAIRDGERQEVVARIDISGAGHHLIQALPRCISVDLSEAPELAAVVVPLVAEVVQPRCGGQAVFHRLSEVVVIRLLRHAIEKGCTDVGLLAGLAHPRLAGALVALHNKPGAPWGLETLAAEAGMSRTQFSVTFKDVLGMTPGAYLANWRLDVARSELEAGTQVKTVARMCGFSSAAAFSRAFARRYGHAPKQERRKAA
ncbi:AraC family transcriptional regulator [Roseibium algae]|uniref:AraC family transcriptional regulator n=1 Tax=Roseibium algae TaxID=3123038 RepID=A0ABU8TMS3_9HYPH